MTCPFACNGSAEQLRASLIASLIFVDCPPHQVSITTAPPPFDPCVLLSLTPRFLIRNLIPDRIVYARVAPGAPPPRMGMGLGLGSGGGSGGGGGGGGGGSIGSVEASIRSEATSSREEPLMPRRGASATSSREEPLIPRRGASGGPGGDGLHEHLTLVPLMTSDDL